MPTPWMALVVATLAAHDGGRLAWPDAAVRTTIPGHLGGAASLL
jgi:hypothetical protein